MSFVVKNCNLFLLSDVIFNINNNGWAVFGKDISRILTFKSESQAFYYSRKINRWTTPEIVGAYRVYGYDDFEIVSLERAKAELLLEI